VYIKKSYIKLTRHYQKEYKNLFPCFFYKFSKGETVVKAGVGVMCRRAKAYALTWPPTPIINSAKFIIFLLIYILSYTLFRALLSLASLRIRSTVIIYWSRTLKKYVLKTAT
jgi:hypothetical protein